MAKPLAERLRERIASAGPLTFRDWMEACLYDSDGGFYARIPHPTGTGPGSHFATAATLHPFWAHAVAREAAAAWRRLGSPAGFRVVEYGAGRLGLAREALRWLDREEADLAASVRWHAVERAPLPAAPDSRIEAGAPASFTGFAVAVEFLDALPFHWLERRGEGWLEVGVGWSGDFRELLLDPAEEALAAAPSGRFAQGQRVASMPAARGWILELGRRLERGEALVVDYGDRGDRLWGPGRPDGTVRGFRGHAGAASVLESPGVQDLTASVDFSQTRLWAEEAGLREESLETQEAFLLRHGILDELNRVPRESLEGASSYLRLRQLLLPTGMGAAFRVQRLVRPAPGAAGRTPPPRRPA